MSFNFTDEELIKMVYEDQDKDAFKFLYDKYKTPIYNYLDKLIFDKESLNDVFQNVFLKVFSKAGTFKNIKGNNFKNWIYRIATNCYIDYYRHNKRIKNNLKYDLNSIEETYSESFEEKIELKEKLTFFYDALSKLDSPYKETFILRFIEEYKIDEIANILDISAKTVKNHCIKAENFIKSYFQKKNN